MCAEEIGTLYDTTVGGGTWLFFGSPDGSAELGGVWSDHCNVDSWSTSGGGGYLTFIDSAGCSTSTGVAFMDPPIPPLGGDTIIHVDTSTILHGAGPGQMWGIADTTIARVDSVPNAGTRCIVTGISPGTTIVSYIYGCTVAATLIVLPSAAVPPISVTNEDGIYPNPATTSLTITSPQKITNLSITNILGQTVYAHVYNSEKVEVNVSGWPAGVYFLKINGSEVRKFVKE